MFQPIYVLYLTVKSMMITNYQLDPLKTTLYIAAFLCLSVHFTLLAVISSVSTNYGKGLSEKGITYLVLMCIKFTFDAYAKKMCIFSLWYQVCLSTGRS